MFEGREYDSKAIAGVAHRHISPGAEPLSAAEFSAGRDTVKRTLERLGFVVTDSARPSADAPNGGRSHIFMG
jgi:5-methylcytosine-specific restriction protein A